MLFFLVDIQIAFGFLFWKHTPMSTWTFMIFELNLIMWKKFLNKFFALLKEFIYLFLKLKFAWKLNLVRQQVIWSNFQGVFHKEETKGYAYF